MKDFLHNSSIVVLVLLAVVVGAILPSVAHAPAAEAPETTQEPLVGAGGAAATWIPTSKYLKPFDATYGLLVPGLATSTTGCLAVGSNGWVSANGSPCGSGSGGSSFGNSWEINAFGALAPTTTIGIQVSASSTIGSGAAAGGLTISGGATTTGNHLIQGNLAVNGSTRLATSLSGVLIAASGAVSAGVDGTDYTLINASTCTNQVHTAVTAAGVFTCASVSNAMLSNSTISGISLGSNLADLTATNGTLTFSGTYNGSTARTIGLNLASANTWTALQQFNANASTTQLSAYRAYFGGSATSTFALDGSLNLATGLTFAGDTFDELVGTGLQVVSGDLQTTLGVAIDTSEITDGTILEADLSVADSPADEDILTSEGTGFEWHSGAELCLAITGSADLCDGNDASGGGGGGSSPFASTTVYTGQDLIYPIRNNEDVVFGKSSSTTAPFWWDVSATTSYIGNGGTADSSTIYGPTSNEWSVGYDQTDKSFSISSSTILGTNPVITIAKTLLTTFSNAVTIVGQTIVGALTATGIVDFGGATSVEIPQNGTVDANGEVVVDDTSGQYRYFAGSSERVLVPWDDVGFTVASSTWGAGTTTVYLPSGFAGYTVTNAYCQTSAGTLGVSLYDGTNRANYIPTASTTQNLYTYSSNNTFTAGEQIRVDVGTAASSPTKIVCNFKRTYTAD